MKPHVIFCTDGIFPLAIGGMQRHSRLLIEHLAKQGKLKISVVHPHPQKVFDPNLNIEEFPLAGIDPKKLYLPECYRYSQRVAGILDENPKAIIYSQGLSAWYNCNKYAHRLIVNPHGLEPFQGISLKDQVKGLPFRLAFRRIFRNCRYLISLGGRLTPILQKVSGSPQQIRCIPNGVEADLHGNFRKGNKSDKVSVLFVGRFAWNKGIHILLEAVRLLNQRGLGDRFQFNLAGSGPLYAKYSSENEPANVRYLGAVLDRELENLYLNSDLFVLPTLFEGMPTVVLEAMAKSLPVIVSDTGATAELVSGDNGYLIAKNNPEILAQALADFSELPAARIENMRKASFEKVRENFTWIKVADLHLKLFSELWQELAQSK